MGKKSLWAGLGLVVLVVFWSGWTQRQSNLAPAKMAVVNLGSLIKGLPEFQAAQATLEKAVDSAQKASDKAVAAFQAQAAQFEQQSKLMSAANREAKMKLLQATQDSLGRDQQLTMNKLRE